MDKKAEITFMQTRLIRLASEEWHLSVEEIVHWFKETDVLEYIEKCYEFFTVKVMERYLTRLQNFLRKRE